MQNSGKTLKFRKHFDVLKIFLYFRENYVMLGEILWYVRKMFFGMSPPSPTILGENINV
jgi:hypothetical protein